MAAAQQPTTPLMEAPQQQATTAAVPKTNDDAELSKPVTFEEVEFDVTDCCFMAICCGSKKLQLLPNEVIYTASTPCSSAVKRLPYSELADVGPTNCLCFNGISSNITTEGVFFFPGCCGVGQVDFVNQVAKELRDRMMHRGDAANLKRSEESLQKIDMIYSLLTNHGAKLDAVLKHLKIEVPQESLSTLPPTQETMSYGTV